MAMPLAHSQPIAVDMAVAVVAADTSDRSDRWAAGVDPEWGTGVGTGSTH